MLCHSFAFSKSDGLSRVPGHRALLETRWEGDCRRIRRCVVLLLTSAVRRLSEPSSADGSISLHDVENGEVSLLRLRCAPFFTPVS